LRCPKLPTPKGRSRTEDTEDFKDGLGECTPERIENENDYEDEKDCSEHRARLQACPEQATRLTPGANENENDDEDEKDCSKHRARLQAQRDRQSSSG